MSWAEIPECGDTVGFVVRAHFDGGSPEMVDRISVRNVGAVNDEAPGAGRAYEAAARKALRVLGGHPEQISSEHCEAGEAEGEAVFFVRVPS
jgi:hypothetical protein